MKAKTYMWIHVSARCFLSKCACETDITNKLVADDRGCNFPILNFIFLDKTVNMTMSDYDNLCFQDFLNPYQLKNIYYELLGVH